jgi:hypothetical protein
MKNNVAFVHICLFILAAGPSEKSIHFYQTTWRHIPEYSAKRRVPFSEKRRERTATSPTQASRVESNGETAGGAVCSLRGAK